jgi:NAD(P)-dependent dehydrogenase (short-subunit alcohol dehydrogenase family)
MPSPVAADRTMAVGTMDTEAKRRGTSGWAAPEAVAQALFFLAPDAAASVTGARVTI